MKHLKNQGGFTALDLILGILLVGAIGAASFIAYQARQTSTKSQTIEASLSTKPTPTRSPIPNPTARWNTYTSAYEQASFKYPSTWTLQKQVGIDPSADDFQVTLISPNNLKLDYSDEVSGLGGGCATDSPSVTLSSIQPLTDVGATSANPIYLVQAPGGVALADKNDWTAANLSVGLTTKSCMFYTQLTSKVHKDVVLNFGTAFGFSTFGTTSGALTSAQLIDLPTAKLILESFRY